MGEYFPSFRSGSASHPKTDLDISVKSMKCEVRRCYEQINGVNEQTFRMHRGVSRSISALSIM
jgi:hypothetical protein